MSQVRLQQRRRRDDASDSSCEHAGRADDSGHRERSGRFPGLEPADHGKPLVYLDNAATTHKPRVVADRVARYYAEENASVHRGAHRLGEQATDAYERARECVRRFLNAAETREIIFVRGTTEAINLVACTYGRAHVGPGDEIVISEMEHHSNIVPWQILCEEKGARLQIIPITDAGELRMERYEQPVERFARASSRSRTSRTRSAPSIRWPRSFAALTPVGFQCSWTVLRPSRICRWTFKPWTAISTPSPVTSCLARPVSASCTVGSACWRGCRPIKGAAA